MKSIFRILSAVIILALVVKNTNAQECVTCGNNDDVAIGQSASTSAYNAVAIGQNTVSNAPNSITIGSIAQSTSTRSITIGSGRFNSSGGNPLVNNRTSIALGIGSNLPTLRVEAAAGYNRTGNVTIGNVADVNDIKAKLHIISDSQEPSGIFLQTSDAFGQATFVKFNDDEHCISVKDGLMNINSGKNEFSITSGNANLTGNLFTLGGMKSKKLSFDANDFPIILSNATRVGSTFYRNQQGSSYAIEFKNDALRIRTAVNQIPRGTEITNWKDALFLMTNGKVGIGSISTYLENYNEQEFRIASPKMITLSSSDLIFNPSRAFVVNGTVNATRGIETGNLVATGDVVLSGLASASSEDILVVGTDGSVSTTSISACGDNLGNHTAENNLNMNGQWIVGSLTSVRGIFIGTNGNVKLGTIGQGVLGNPETALEVDGTVYSTALEVNGRIRSKEVVVESSGWSDFVFENDYNMMSLKDVEDYINEHGHLPNVPSAEEIEENGINVSEMNAILLQKIEELTLHLIEAEKRIEELERR